MFAHVLPKLRAEPQIEIRPARALDAIRTFVRETACAAKGHDYLLHAGRDRICLRCVGCGHETPGWRIDAGARHAIDRCPHA